jgi:LETM1-like protein
MDTKINTLAPNASGWISKYFALIERGEIRVTIRKFDEITDVKHIHLRCSRSGIVFGIPTRAIFGNKLNTKNWTNEEKLKTLLFEALLFVHLKMGGKLDKDDFVNRLTAFYGKHNTWSLTDTILFFRKDSPEVKLEKILAKRVDIRRKLLDNKWWVNGLSNAFVYLDVILFHDFCLEAEHNSLSNYRDFAQDALTAITLGAHADGHISSSERDLFNVFVASANLSEDQRYHAEYAFENGARFADFSEMIHSHWLLKHFLFDICVMTVFSKLDTSEEERKFIEELGRFMEIPEHEKDETLMYLENFIINNRNKSDFLNDAAAFERAYGSFSNRWKKILLRNKDKLAIELSESKELVQLMKKSMREELSSEEKEKVKVQLKDLLKSMPAFAVFLIPGGSLLLPMMMKIIPDLLPSAFKDNQIDE